MELFEKLKKIKNINLIQFVPLIFVISLVGNSVFGYTEPEATKQILTKEVSAETTAEEMTTTAEEKKTAVNGGDLDLSKINDGTYKGSGNGYRGVVKVAVVVKDHKITDITILSNVDDASFFNRAKSGVIASILSSQSLNVDAVSGATYSSKGIIAAVKNALTGVTDQSSAAAASAGVTAAGTASKLSKADESGTYKDGTYEGSGTGFRGTVKVSVTIKNSKITNIKILSKQDDESFFRRAKSGVVSAILKKQSTNVDTVSGATYSSNGIIEAVRNALKKARINPSSEETKGTETASNKSSQTVSPASTTTAAVNPGATLKGNYKNGTYRGEGEGWGGTTVVSVTIKSNRITKLNVVSHEDTPSFFEQAKVVLDRIKAVQSTDVDIVSGATYSSNGLKEAVSNALKAAKTSASATTENKTETSTESTTESSKDTADSTESSKEPETEESKSVTYSTSVWCYCSVNEWDFEDYLMNVDIVVKDGKITSIAKAKDSTSSKNTTNDIGYIKYVVNGFNKQIAAGKDAADVDIVSGATCSSNAMKQAIKDVLGKIN
jgi:uncharacterized protein with FMN-binding domain